MGKIEKILVRILGGTSDSNIPFSDLCNLLKSLGFDLRIKGNHHIFTKDGVKELINLQPKKGISKNYQVKQVRDIIISYKLGDKAYE